MAPAWSRPMSRKEMAWRLNTSLLHSDCFHRRWKSYLWEFFEDEYVPSTHWQELERGRAYLVLETQWSKLPYYSSYDYDDYEKLHGGVLKFEYYKKLSYDEISRRNMCWNVKIEGARHKLTLHLEEKPEFGEEKYEDDEDEYYEDLEVWEEEKQTLLEQIRRLQFSKLVSSYALIFSDIATAETFEIDQFAWTGHTRPFIEVLDVCSHEWSGRERNGRRYLYSSEHRQGTIFLDKMRKHNAAKERRGAAAIRVWRRIKRALYDPHHPMGKRRLAREFKEMHSKG